MHSFFWDAQGYVQEHVSRRLDFASRMAGIFGDQLEGIDSSPLVLLTRSADAEADTLSVALAHRGVVVTRVDSDFAPGTCTLTHLLSPALGDDAVVVQVNEIRTKPNPLIYFRHFDASAMTGQRASLHTDQQAFDIYLREQWSAAMRGLCYGSQVINAPRHVACLDRLTQMKTAQESGFPTPRGIVTNNIDRIREFVRTCEKGAIIKALGDHFVEQTPGRLHGIFPKLIRDAASLDDLVVTSRDPAPLLCQEYISHENELRVYVAGDCALAFSVLKSSCDSEWSDPHSLVIAISNEHDAALGQAIQVVKRAALQVAALDFLVTDGKLIFLELNAVGDWKWLESRLDRDWVTDLHVEYLLRLLQWNS